MDVAANLTISQRDKGLASEHMPQADEEKQSILIDPLRAESRDVKGLGDKRPGRPGYCRVQSCCRILVNCKRDISFHHHVPTPLNHPRSVYRNGSISLRRL